MIRNPTSDFKTRKCQLKVWFWTNFKSTFGFLSNRMSCKQDIKWNAASEKHLEHI